MKNRDSLILFFLFFASLAYFKFYRPIVLGETLLKFIYYIFLAFIIGLSFKEFVIKKNKGYSLLMSYFIYLVLISVFSAYLFWDQSPFLTIVSSLSYFSFFFFFFLKRFKVKINLVEKVVWCLLVTYIICFTYAFLKAPTIVFAGYGASDSGLSDSRGLFRIRITAMGAGPLYISYFMAISKFLKTKLKIWLMVIVVLFAFIALQLGRQAILISFVLGFMYYFSKVSLIKKVLLIFACYGLIWFSINKIPMVTNLIELSEKQIDSNEDEEDIRLQAYKFYMYEMPTNVFTGFFGKGMYTLVKGNRYGDYINKNGRDKGLIPADVGYGYVYLLFGAFGIAIFFLISIKAYKQKVPEEYNYLKYYIYFLMISNFGASPLLLTIPTYSMAVYILYVLEQNNNQLSYEKN